MHRETGSRRWISALGVLACVAALGALIWQTVRTDPSQLWILAAMVGLAFTIEALYRLWGRELKLGR